MEDLFFGTFLYIAVFCFFCCLTRNSNKTTGAEYNPIDLSPIWNDIPTPLPNLDEMTSRQLRLLASEIKFPSYSRILREQKTEGLRQALREYLRVNQESLLSYRY